MRNDNIVIINIVFRIFNIVRLGNIFWFLFFFISNNKKLFENVTSHGWNFTKNTMIFDLNYSISIELSICVFLGLDELVLE